MIKEPQMLLVSVDGINRMKDNVERAWRYKRNANDKGIHVILGV